MAVVDSLSQAGHGAGKPLYMIIDELVRVQPEPLLNRALRIRRPYVSHASCSFQADNYAFFAYVLKGSWRD